MYNIQYYFALHSSCSEARLNTASLQLPQQFSSSPSLHVMLVTTAHRPQLFGMLASLQELTHNDFLTIIIDNNHFTNISIHNKTSNNQSRVEFYHQGLRINSTFLNSAPNNRSSNIINIWDIERYARSILSCRVHIIVELSGPLGHWGHSARNMYREVVLEVGGDFVWHVDDDNVVLPGAVGLIKKTCNGSCMLCL